MLEETTTLTPRLQRSVLRYRGKWVALTSRRILAVGDSRSEVLAEATRKGYKSPLIYRVPEKSTAAYY
jgi:hypothetical protein